MCQFHQIMIIRHYLTKKPDMKVSQELLAISKMITHWVMAIKKTIVDYRFFIECDIMSLLWACYRFSIFLVAVYPSSDFTFTK